MWLAFSAHVATNSMRKVVDAAHVFTHGVEITRTQEQVECFVKHGITDAFSAYKFVHEVDGIVVLIGHTAARRVVFYSLDVVALTVRKELM